MTTPRAPRVRAFERAAYPASLEAMRAFTAARDATTDDEIWLVEHPPVFTLGLAGRTEHLLDPGDIPVERTERGGQVTYHGPGQVVAYLMIDLHRRGLGVRALVTRIEQAAIALLARHGVACAARADAPGVYVLTDGKPGAKIASLGLKVSRGRSYHGVALNVDMDLAPFERIHPCGHPGMRVTDLAHETGAAPGSLPVAAIAAEFGALLAEGLQVPAGTTPAVATPISC
jgi:lipoyl(octanoyl) transferase